MVWVGFLRVLRMDRIATVLPMPSEKTVLTGFRSAGYVVIQ